MNFRIAATILIVVGLALVGGFFLGAKKWFQATAPPPPAATIPPYTDGGPNITNFADCIAAGYPIMESYPRQCAIPGGRRFVEDINTPIPTPTPRPASSQSLQLMSRTIETPKGILTLMYKEGIATLEGELMRSTPCVNWQVTMTSTKDFPPSMVEFNIADKNKGQICIQVLGEPQHISVKTAAVQNAHYTVTLEGEKMFEGRLSEGK